MSDRTEAINAKLLYACEEMLAHIEWMRSRRNQKTGANDCTHRARAAIELAKGKSNV